MNTIQVVKRDGSRQAFDAEQINLSLVQATEGMPDQIQKVVQVATELQLTLFDGITTKELDEALIHTALQNVKDDPDYDTIAARLLLKNIYKNVLGKDYASDAELKQLHAAAFPKYIRAAVKHGLLDPRMADAKLFDHKKLAAALEPSRDQLSKYLGVITNRNRYAMRQTDGAPIETPQFTHMRIAMGLSFNEKDPTSAAIGFYTHMSKLEYLPGGSTRVNAGGANPQLSNCFVIDVQDDMESIAQNVRNLMWISKGTGGIGMSLSKLRAAGSPVVSTNTTSTGPIPFMKVMDTALFAVSRKGKKMGAAALYMENWHLDVREFLDLRQNSGDPYLRTRYANTAIWISDEFMKRVQQEEAWYLFDPRDTPDLTELYGAAFSKRYAEYIELAEAGKLRKFRKMPARQLYRDMLTQLQSTSHPWFTWKDTINTRALNNNRSTIHSSNLCTEITLPNDAENISVCNLISINLSAFLDIEHKTWDWQGLERATRSAIRQLDNLCDISDLPVPEAINSIRSTRALGLGIMGFTDVIEKLGYSYESEASYDTMDQLAEFISYYAIDESAELAKQKGSYPDFDGSGWSKGELPIDTVDLLEIDRRVPVDVTRKKRLDWEKLRAKTRKGMRNATLMAIAPTANIGHVAGTTPGIDPQFGQIFSRSTLNGKFLEVNANLVRDLKKLNLWERVKDQLLVEQGDLTNLDVPQELKDVYKTCFQLSPFAFIEVAARAQKWVDQAISRNMYLESRSIDDMELVYMEAWKRGLKTTYYLHMKPRHQAEQSTTKVNKAEAIAAGTQRKAGFGFAKKQGA